MEAYLDESVYTNALPEIQTHCKELHARILQTGERIEGNCMTYHQDTHFAPELVTKQRNLLALYKSLPPGSKCMEIGVNAGHSLLLWYMGADPTCSIDLFDIGEHAYLTPCLQYLNSAFPGRSLQICLGDSKQTLLRHTLSGSRDIYDCIHLDGGHSMDCAMSDMIHSLLLLKPNGYLIIDDVNNADIYSITQMLVQGGFVRVVESQLDTYLYKHLIVQKN